MKLLFLFFVLCVQDCIWILEIQLTAPYKTLIISLLYPKMPESSSRVWIDANVKQSHDYERNDVFQVVKMSFSNL